MTGREKQLKTKKYPKAEEFEFNHIALLAFVGKFIIILQREEIRVTKESVLEISLKNM
jgi:hypothetical protein